MDNTPLAKHIADAMADKYSDETDPKLQKANPEDKLARPAFQYGELDKEKEDLIRVIANNIGVPTSYIRSIKMIDLATLHILARYTDQ